MRGTMAIENDKLHMSTRMFIVVFYAVAIRFWEGSYFTVFDLESAWLMTVAIFCQRGQFWKPEGPIPVGCLGKEKRQEVMVRCFCRPTLNCNLSKSVFLCPYFILDVQYFLYFPFIHLTVLAQSFLVVYSVFRYVCDL